jgi:hypothetical protein
MKDEFVTAFERPGGFDSTRNAVANSAREVQIAVTETRLKTFCLRLADQTLPEQEWVEAVGSLLCSKPPAKWVDRDESAFREEFARLVRLFRRVESTAFAARNGARAGAVRVAITCQDGTEVEQVVYHDTAEEGRVAELESTFFRIIATEKRIGLVAASRALRRCMEQAE